MKKYIDKACPTCGHVTQHEACPDCDGKGYILREFTDETRGYKDRINQCESCGGTGIKDGWFLTLPH